MTIALIGKTLVLKGSTTKIEDIHRFQVIYIDRYTSTYSIKIAMMQLE